MNAVRKTHGKFILVEESALSAREKSAEDQYLLTRSLEDDVLRQLLLRVLIRLEELEKREKERQSDLPFLFKLQLV